MSLPSPTLLEFHREPPLKRPYANLYRFGAEQTPGPVVVYLGGFVTAEVWEARRRTAPTAIVEQFEVARVRTGCARVDLLVCPCPVNTEGLGDEWVLDHYDDELAPTLKTSPTALGCVGYSAGAGLATTLALFNEARALAVIGAAGLTRTLGPHRPMLEAWAREGREPLEADWFMNDQDPGGIEAPALARLPPALRFRQRRAAGTHAFSDYAANGSVAGAFRCVLERLGRQAS